MDAAFGLRFFVGRWQRSSCAKRTATAPFHTAENYASLH
ncbi:hypothetical protein Z947_1941 [Sulfitobacter geojensis]|nr:hypothetical protein Z947_1941 [Sulfitobacter geojensis]